MIADHADAIDLRLKTIDRPVYDSKAPTEGPPRYVVFYLTTPEGRSRRLSTDAPKARFLLSTMYVGSTPWECREMARLVHQVLVGHRLVVAGRLCTPFVAPNQPDQVRPDNEINPPAFIATNLWPFTSTPITEE